MFFLNTPTKVIAKPQKAYTPAKIQPPQAKQPPASPQKTPVSPNKAVEASKKTPVQPKPPVKPKTTVAPPKKNVSEIIKQQQKQIETVLSDICGVIGDLANKLQELEIGLEQQKRQKENLQNQLNNINAYLKEVVDRQDESIQSAFSMIAKVVEDSIQRSEFDHLIIQLRDFQDQVANLGANVEIKKINEKLKLLQFTMNCMKKNMGISIRSKSSVFAPLKNTDNIKQPTKKTLSVNYQTVKESKNNTPLKKSINSNAKINDTIKNIKDNINNGHNITNANSQSVITS